MLYIYIYIYIYTQNSIFGGSEKDRFLDRFWRGLWIDFGKVFGEVLERFLEILLIFFSYYSACRVGKDLGRALEVILMLAEMNLQTFLNDLEAMLA